ncbi:alpha-galactosidase [bacterium]|nr:alpha-galactosidase [bacterium]
MQKAIVLGITMLIMASSPPIHAESAQSWPHTIPCRIKDSANHDLFVMTLGDVHPSLADGVFDPVKDQVSLKDGTTIDHYYRDTLKIGNYAPLDKTHFPLPPSGWCTWCYYYGKINEDEVMRNAKWISDNLKEYGAQYVQIDFGWQGSSAKEGKCDWSNVDPVNFSSGMPALAHGIKSLGLKPGIWIVPHGQTNPAFVKNNPNVFLLKSDGTSSFEEWIITFLVDPTTAESEVYLTDLFREMCDWGYDYFKIDGLQICFKQYRDQKEFMRNPDDDSVKLYRKTLNTIRSAIGPDRYLLGGCGFLPDGIGLLNGSRNSGDVRLGWDGGFMMALRAAQRDYYLHNIVWYNDPDEIILRSPLTYSQAQAWATLQGLSGLSLMAADRLDDLSEPRVELMRRIYPAVNVRPLDLFQVDQNKRIWDLKVNHLDRHYDVVGLFNYDKEKRETMYIRWADLGLAADQPIHVFDFWNQEYLGVWESGMLVDVNPTSCRVLAISPDSGEIQLISTNRHITQGWVDLNEAKYDASTNTYAGESKVIKDDPYELRFVFPKGENYIIQSALVKKGRRKLPVTIANHQGWATIKVVSDRSDEIQWNVKFVKSVFFPVSAHVPVKLSVQKSGPNSVDLTWNESYTINSGYRVYLNGKMLGYTPKAMFPLSGLDPDLEYTAEVESTWEDGSVSGGKASIEFFLNTIDEKTEM